MIIKRAEVKVRCVKCNTENEKTILIKIREVTDSYKKYPKEYSTDICCLCGGNYEILEVKKQEQCNVYLKHYFQ